MIYHTTSLILHLEYQRAHSRARQHPRRTLPIDALVQVPTIFQPNAHSTGNVNPGLVGKGIAGNHLVMIRPDQVGRFVSFQSNAMTYS